MLLPIIAVLVGLILLVWSADRFISGATATAKHFKVPSLVIGLVIIGFGTSMPEMVVSVMAALDGNPELALGNAMGSNIVNAGLVLGLTALIAPIIVSSNIIRREVPILIVIGLILGYFLYDGAFARLEAMLLVVGFVTLIVWTIHTSYRSRSDHLAVEVEQHSDKKDQPVWASVVWLVVGLSVLIASSRVLVWGAVSIAEQLGMSSLIIGLTIVALGTSLPELASSVIAARRGEHDMAIGNVIGSNMFNILAVAGVSGLIAPIQKLSNDVFIRDWSVMIFLSLALLPIVYSRTKTGRINRIEGVILLLIYLAYIFVLIRTIT